MSNSTPGRCKPVCYGRTRASRSGGAVLALAAQLAGDTVWNSHLSQVDLSLTLEPPLPNTKIMLQVYFKRDTQSRTLFVLIHGASMYTLIFLLKR